MTTVKIGIMEESKFSGECLDLLWMGVENVLGYRSRDEWLTNQSAPVA